MTYRRIMKCAAIGILSIIISPVFGFETPGNAESIAEMQREQAERRREEADRQRREEAERERRERAEETARERRAEAERERREELQRQRAEEATRARAEAEQQRREQAARERAAEQQREREMERQRQDRLREEQQRAAREQEERQREARVQMERAAQTRAAQERETRLREEQRRAAQEQEMRQRESRIQAERAAQARDQEARQRALRNDKPTPRQIVVPQPVAPATAPSPVRASVKYQSPPAANPHERVPLPWAVKESGPNVVVVMPPSPSLSSDPVQDELIADVGNIQPGGRYNECVNYFYDQKNFDTLTIRNDCGEAVHWANRSGSGDILPGRQAGTGDSRRVVAERPSILDITLCPMGFNPIGADGHYWSGGAYRCKYDANAAQSTSYGRVPAAAWSSSAAGIRSAVPPSPPPSDSIPEPPTIYQPGGEFNNCVSFGYDPNNYNWYTIKNGCGEAIHWVTTTNMAGDTAPGRKGGTGESSDEVARHPGWEWAICRAGYVPYDAEGRFWTGGMYRCGPR